METDDLLLREAVRRIVDGFHPRRVVLFGSRARGEARGDSDYDLLLLLDDVPSPRCASVRIRFRI